MAHFISYAGGNWNDPATWDGANPTGTYPGMQAGDTAEIQGASVTMALTDESQLPYPVGYTLVDNWGWLDYNCSYEPTHAHFNDGLHFGPSGVFWLDVPANTHVRLSLDPPASGHALYIDEATFWFFGLGDYETSQLTVYLNNTADRDCGMYLTGDSRFQGNRGVPKQYLDDAVVAGQETFTIRESELNPRAYRDFVGNVVAFSAMGNGSATELVEIVEVVSMSVNPAGGTGQIYEATYRVKQYGTSTLGFAYPHGAGCVVSRLSSSIKIIGKTDYPTNTYITGPPTPTKMADLDYCEFINFGGYREDRTKSGFCGSFPQGSTNGFHLEYNTYWQTPGNHPYPRKYPICVEFGNQLELYGCTFYNASSSGGVLISTGYENNTAVKLTECSLMNNKAPLLGTSISSATGFVCNGSAFVGTSSDSATPTAPDANPDTNCLINITGLMSASYVFSDSEFYFMETIIRRTTRNVGISFSGCRFGVGKRGEVSRLGTLSQDCIGHITTTNCNFDPSRSIETYSPSSGDTYQSDIFKFFANTYSSHSDLEILYPKGVLSVDTVDGRVVLKAEPRKLVVSHSMPTMHIGPDTQGYTAFAFPAAQGDNITVTIYTWGGGPPPTSGWWEPSSTIRVRGPGLDRPAYSRSVIGKVDWSTPVLGQASFIAPASGIFNIELSIYTFCISTVDGRNNPPIYVTFPVVSGNTLPSNYLSSPMNFTHGYPQLCFPVGRSMPLQL